MSVTTPTSTLPLASGTWTVDPVHSQVAFSVRHLGISKVRGEFGRFTTELVVGQDLASSRVSAVVQLSSVDTGNADRDAHLQSADFFNTETNPVMTFESTSITAAADGYQLSGDLTLNGTTRPVVLDVEFYGTEQNPMDSSTRAGFGAATTISRRDFGITFDIPMGVDKVAISDKVSINLDIQLVAG